MKSKKVKTITAVVLAVIMVLSVVPMFAFASGSKPVKTIAVECAKPYPCAAYAEPNGKANPEFKISVAKGCGLKVEKERWLAVTKDGTQDFIPAFWGNADYLMSVKLKVKSGYQLPEKLDALKVTIKYDGEKALELSKDQYREPDKFKMESGTYTIKYLNEPRSADKKDKADIELLYVTTVGTLEMPQMVVTTKKPVDKDLYILPSGTNEEYKISLSEGAGFYVEKEGWLHFDNKDRIHFDNEFLAGNKYILAVGLTFNPRYGMYDRPENLKDVKIKIDFTNAEDVVLTNEQYREPDKFNFETGTYTLKDVRDQKLAHQYELMYVIEIPEAEKPVEKPTDKPTDKPSEIQTTVANTKAPETTAAKTETETKVPNTGVTGSIAACVLAVSAITAGAAYTMKKKHNK